MTTTCALDVRLRANTLITTWSLSPIPSTVRGDSNTPGLAGLEEDILATVGGARGATTHLVITVVITVVIIMDLDTTAMVAMDPLAQVVQLAVLGVDSVEEVAAVQGEHSVAVGVVEVLRGGVGEARLSRKPGSGSSRLVVPVESPWRLVPTLNSNNNLLSHPARRRERASFKELDKLCLVSWSHLV